MHLNHLLASLSARLRRQEGFTMVTVLGVMMVGTLFTTAAVAAANGDIFGSQNDVDSKGALAAAEAGVNDYQFHLDRDLTYWSKCTSVPNPSAVNQRWNGSGVDPRKWRQVPGSEAKYAIELLPANGSAECSTATPDTSMIDATSNTFRVRSTGVARKGKRSLVATFKRRSFLDYVYFTDYETQDPTFLAGYPNNYATWAAANCVRWWRDGRGNQSQPGTNASCQEINFVSQENLKGPFHSNDEILICGTPTFGDRGDDSIEVAGPAPNQTGQGWRACPSNPSSQPNFVGAWRPRSPVLQLPLSNAKLKTIADPAYRFAGKTTIELQGNTLKVNGVSKAWPPNGVLYVDSNGTGCKAYNLFNPYESYSQANQCATVELKGNYNKDLTIAAAQDILVTGNVTRDTGSSGLLGLVANQFVRVYHPVTGSYNGDNDSCPNASNAPKNVRIDAAMLALTHVFVVDNYFCGDALGTLTVNGGIAQKFRGPVGTFSSSGDSSGFLKNYVYDRRLRNREPPFFLDPVQSSWAVLRQTEQVPAR